MPTKPTDYVTKSELKRELVDLEDRLSTRIIGEVSSVIRQFSVQVDDRFTETEASIFKVRQDLSEIKADSMDIRLSINRLTNTIDGFVKRLDDLDAESTAQDAQYQRLLAWAEKVSAKTGIPLEY